VLPREVHVGQRLGDAALYPVSSFLELHLPQFLGDRLCLLLGRLQVFLRMDRLQHRGHRLHLGSRHEREHVAIEVDRAALELGFRVDLVDRFQEPQALVADEELSAFQPALLQHLQEREPARLVLLHAFCCTDDLPVPFLVDRHRHQDRDVLVFAAPVALQVDSIQVDVGILALQWPLAPFLDVDVHLLVQLADGAGRHARTPQDLRDVLHTAHGDSREVHFDQRLLDADLALLVALDDRRLECQSAQLRHLQVHFAGLSQQFSVVVAGSRVDPILAPFVPSGVRQAVGFLVQQLVQRLLHGIPDQRAQLFFYRALVQLYNLLGHVLNPLPW